MVFYHSLKVSENSILKLLSCFFLFYKKQKKDDANNDNHNNSNYKLKFQIELIEA